MALLNTSALVEQKKMGDLRSYRVESLQFGDEGVSANDVECADTEDLLWVVFAGLLENLGGNGDSAVNRVRDDGDDSIRTDLGSSLARKNVSGSSH